MVITVRMEPLFTQFMLHRQEKHKLSFSQTFDLYYKKLNKELILDNYP